MACPEPGETAAAGKAVFISPGAGRAAIVLALDLTLSKKHKGMERGRAPAVLWLCKCKPLTQGAVEKSWWTPLQSWPAGPG